MKNKLAVSQCQDEQSVDTSARVALQGRDQARDSAGTRGGRVEAELPTAELVAGLQAELVALRSEVECLRRPSGGGSSGWLVSAVALAVLLLPVGALAFEPLWTDFVAGEPISAREMNGRFQAISQAIHEVEEQVPDWNDVPDATLLGGNLQVRYEDASLHLRTDNFGDSYIANKANFVGNGSTGGGELVLIGSGGVGIYVGESGRRGTEMISASERHGVLIEGLRMFVKAGNDGSVSCEAYCQAAEQGLDGSCIGSRLPEGAGYSACDTVVGSAVDCMCMR